MPLRNIKVKFLCVWGSQNFIFGYYTSPDIRQMYKKKMNLTEKISMYMLDISCDDGFV